jgi:hypothetical protein
MFVSRLSLCAACYAALFAVPASAGLTGLWEFENPASLTTATVGNNLVLAGSDTAVAGSGSGVDLGAAAVGVGSHYRVDHGAAPNGGGNGTYVNQFSILWDVSFPQSSAGSWRTFWQSSTTNANDGELFIRPSGPQGAIGVGDLGYSTNTLAADTWYRVVMTVENGVSSKVYVNGVEWIDGGAEPIDGRFSLDTITSASGNPFFLALGDNDGDDALMNLSNLAVWDSALSASEVIALGGAGRVIGVPEPAALALAAMGLLALRRRV